MNNSTRAVPATWNIGIAWMEKVIAKHYPEARLKAFHRIGGSDGTSSRALFALEYASGDGPKTVFAKTKGNWLRRFFHAMTGNAYIEGSLCNSGVDLCLEHPLFYYGAVDKLRMNDVIVMEDVGSRGATLNDATTPLTVDQVATGLKELAKMHSAFWGLNNKTHPELKWVRPWKASGTFTFLMKYGCGRGIQRLLDYLPAQVVDAGPRMLVDAWAEYLRSLSIGPQTLLHGDAHVGNTYLLPDGGFGFYDWGVVRRGHWSFDVGYFLVSALSVEDRREHERHLLRLYIDSLTVGVADKPGFDEAWLHYRCSPAYGLPIWICTGAEDDYQSPAICQNLAQRFGSAFVELDTRDALTSIVSSRG
ncbi:phosphotransferase [Zhongshania aquimaris]|uniref:Phosphotransferase n=1 Tax=Zhongshania aquimaris TaxID=2857107 RepID=A0ABS6VPX6_9GAMM|nr:phosphotransferase [Zhongshania aquimaris]MBW2940369.1 phosphotransferase [Zhongshania aquimaris]